MVKKKSKTKILLHTSPHVTGSTDVRNIMLNVVLATLPLVLFMIYQFGLSAFALLIVVCGACLMTEYLFAYFSGKENPLSDLTVLITGMLMTLTLPPGLPLWMGFVAGVSGVGLAKVVFGGIGSNVFNPALVGRAFVAAAFPVSVNTWPPAFFEGRFTSFIPTTLTPPFLSPPDITAWSHSFAIDTFSGATPLAQQKFEQVQVPTWELFAGIDAAYLTNAPAGLTLICGLYLAFRNMLDWRIPVTIMASAAALAGAMYLVDPTVYPDPLFVLFSGGLMLGAWFMASDMVASPVTPWGVIIYGALIGFLTVIIRLFGGMPEGAMYAILLGNAASPLIEKVTQPHVFGWKRNRGAAAK